MRSANTPVQITSPNYSREPLSGKVGSALAYGSLVQIKTGNTVGDPPELIACNGGIPAILESKVVSNEDWQAHKLKDQAFVDEIRGPVPVDSVCTARFAHLAEFEGDDYFTDIDGDSTPGTALAIADGKFVEADLEAFERVVAYLREKVTPYDSSSFRWVVEFVQ